MGWLRKGKDRETTTLADDARAALVELRTRINQHHQNEEWNALENDMIAIMHLLREQNDPPLATQSLLAELYAQWGLALEAERRYQDAYQRLGAAERLINMDFESASRWAEGEKITLGGEGEDIDLDLALAALRTLGEGMMRLGNANAEGVLLQVIAVADMVGNVPEQWASRARLAALRSSLTDWDGLMEAAREMGQFARRERSLPHLLEAMRQFSEAYLGNHRLQDAITIQRLIVDIAAFLKDPSLPDEERELAKLISNSV